MRLLLLFFPIALLALAGCTRAYVKAEELEALPPLSAHSAKKVIREKLPSGTQTGASIERVEFQATGIMVHLKHERGRREACFYPLAPRYEVLYDRGGGGYVIVPRISCNYFILYWQDGAAAKACAHAMLSLSSAASQPTSPDAELAQFKARAPALRAKASEELPEDARRYRVQAEDAVSEKRFEDASDLFGKALEAAPWWVNGYFNRALVLGELEAYPDAIDAMRRYLILAPDAPDARDAQDKIYSWEGKAQMEAR